MDPLVRSWRPFLIAVVALGSVAAAQACGSPNVGAMVGVSERPSGGTRGATQNEVRDGGPLEGATALPSDYRTRFAKVNKSKIPSAGHAVGRWNIEVWANEPALKALAVRSRDVPVGAILVQEHFEKTVSGARGPIMVMEKRAKGFDPEHGDWRYTVVGSTGLLVNDGVVASCAGCHDDAPMDGLFPIME